MHAPIEKIRGEVFNVGTGISISVMDIARKLLEIFNLDEKNLSYMEERFGQVQNHISSTEKSEKVLGFKATVPFEDGLQTTIEWYKENRSLWERQMFFRHVPVKTMDGSIVWY
jgi:dTDP-glucose 4,6-dehydratase